MSFVHFDEVYDICCELCVLSDEKTELIHWDEKQMKNLAVFHQALSDEHLLEKV